MRHHKRGGKPEKYFLAFCAIFLSLFAANFLEASEVEISGIVTFCHFFFHIHPQNLEEIYHL